MSNVITPQALTPYEAISLIVSIVGFVIVIVSLWLTRRQAKSGADSLKSTAYQSCATQMFAFDAIFVKYPELHQYFYSGKDVSKDDPDYERVIAISELFLDYIDTVLTQQEHLPTFWPIDGWQQYFTDIFSKSPILCECLEANKKWYPDRMIQLMKVGKTEH